MKAIVVTDQAAGTAGMKLMERPSRRTRASYRARTTAMSLTTLPFPPSQSFSAK
jgi:hypothetical protein